LESVELTSPPPFFSRVYIYSYNYKDTPNLFTSWDRVVQGAGFRLHFVDV